MKQNYALSWTYITDKLFSWYSNCIIVWKLCCWQLVDRYNIDACDFSTAILRLIVLIIFSAYEYEHES